MREVYIVGATRTPIGSFGGSLAAFTATQLGAFAIEGLLNQTNVPKEEIQEVLMGNVLSAGLGQAPATQAAKFAGLPDLPASTINKVCASGMKAIMLAAQSIALGDKDVIIAGGMESMSNAPYYLTKARTGYKLGNGELVDGLVKDGLWDVYNDYHMGAAAELCAAEYSISRLDQDAFAVQSYQRSQQAMADGRFLKEITPIHWTDKAGKLQTIASDEEPTKVNFDKIPNLKPVFKKEGTVTAANASTINDGAAAVLLMSKEKANALGLKPLAKIISYADAQQAPEWFTTAPAKAIPLALAKANMQLPDVDFFEINEAFSVVALVNNQKLGISPDRVNVNGGAVALGHPLGASGARIIVTLLQVLQQNKGKFGVAGICNGGGGASAMVIENLR